MGNTFTISPLQCGKLVCLSPSVSPKICEKINTYELHSNVLQACLECIK
jgi:hypothetical protein